MDFFTETNKIIFLEGKSPTLEPHTCVLIEFLT